MATDRGLFYFDSAGMHRTIRGHFTRVDGPSLFDSKRSYDLTVVVLNPQADGSTPETAMPALEQSWLARQLLERDGRTYMVLGFPRSKSSIRVNHSRFNGRAPGFDIEGRPYVCITKSSSDETSRRLGVTSLQFAINYDKHEDRIDELGRRTTLPNPEGMSGSPVYVVHDDTPDGTPIQLVGVAVAYHRIEKALIVADSELVLNLMLNWHANSKPDSFSPSVTPIMFHRT